MAKDSELLVWHGLGARKVEGDQASTIRVRQRVRDEWPVASPEGGRSSRSAIPTIQQKSSSACWWGTGSRFWRTPVRTRTLGTRHISTLKISKPPFRTM